MTREDAEAFVPAEPAAKEEAAGGAICPKCRQPVEGEKPISAAPAPHWNGVARGARK